MKMIKVLPIYNLGNKTKNENIEKIRKIIGTENFVFNNNCGNRDVAIVLEILLEEQDKILETLLEPIEYGTERYKEVHEHLRTVPRFEHYQPDPTKGNGINVVLTNRYYDEVSSALNIYISERLKKDLN